jgi:phospholipid transport system substrate-binding protein
MKPRRLVALAIGTHPAGAQPKAAADQTEPLDLVKASVSQVLALVQSPHVVVSDGGQRRTDIRRVAQGLFDFNEMARLTLARHWKDRSAQEQEEFVRLFTDLLEYRLLENGARWAVYDVVLDGVSLVSNYRSQFNSIIRTSSFADLLAKLRNKQIEEHVIPRTGHGS